ncbi:putative quinol monooxygenase [Streptomyces sp. NPDC088729]|uniref:putative quinol monooxygenase n=1 Tax=Streptomyces sp. NPDC088729 TaxID=3365876 RepID=UPI0038079079
MNTTDAAWPLADARPGEIVVIARWTLDPEHRDTVRAALAELIDASRAEPGCLGYQSYDDHGAIVLIERYAGPDALQAHRDSDHFRRAAQQRIVPLLTERQVVVTTVG